MLWNALANLQLYPPLRSEQPNNASENVPKPASKKPAARVFAINWNGIRPGSRNASCVSFSHVATSRRTSTLSRIDRHVETYRTNHRRRHGAGSGNTRPTRNG